jgi:vacuolar protein sorting-associated protein 13A/C
MDRLREYVTEKEKDRQYILKPVSGKAGLELDKTGSIDKPRVKARLIFDELGFVLDRDQYRDALMLVDLFHYFIRHREYKKLQPKSRPKEDPRAWLLFAGNAILSKIHERNRRTTWAYIKERRDDRLQYIDLFKKKKRGEALSAHDAAEMQRLEEKLSYEDLRFWRSLARNQLRKENVGMPKPQRQATWSEWIWGSQKKEDDTTMTEEQRKELYEVIDWDEKKAITEAVDLPKNTVKFQVESTLRTGSFTLKRSPDDKPEGVIRLVFDNFNAKALQRPDSFLVQVDLRGLRLFDRTVEGTLFPQIIKVKDTEEEPSEDETHHGELPVLEHEEPNLDFGREDSLFHLLFEKNPLDGSADSAIKMKLKSVEVIYNPLVLVEVVKFFRPPERHMESINALLETAGATVEEIRQQTRAGLEFALEEHKTLNAQLDIHAPLIIIPESIVTESSTCLIVDAGRIGVTSKLVDEEKMKMIQNKHGRDYDDKDYQKLEDLMYDRFLLTLDSTQVLIGPGIEATKAQLESGSLSKNFHIIDRISMDFVFELCIVPQSTELTRTRLSGHLPELHASISDKKYKDLMRLIDIAIPRFDDDGQATPEVVEERPSTSRGTKEAETRQRSQSVVLASQKEIAVVHPDSDTEDEGPRKAREFKKKVNIRRRMFEFKFTVDKLRGSLYRSDPADANKDRLLVELVAEHFQLNYYLREYDMGADVVLKSLSVDDYIEHNPSPEFKQILSSKGFDASEDKDLFTLKFVKVNPRSPEFNRVYNGVEMNLDLSVSTINLIVTRRTLLTLLDFVLITFTNQEQPQPRQDVTERSALEDSEDQKQETPPTRGKIRIQSKLESIALILNDDGNRLATLSLNTADVEIFLSGPSMRIQGRMGSLTLYDDMDQKGPHSSARRLMSIEGEDFADWRYQTFDPQTADYPGYNSEVFLRSGSIKVNFIEDPYRRIVNFLVKFGKMQGIFNAARQAAANQASQIQESASLMRFDVLVRTPILVFPKIRQDEGPSDFITVHLGEFYANNQFRRLEDTTDGPSVNVINVGMRHIRLTSHFYYGEDSSEVLEMIEKVDLDFDVRYLPHQPNSRLPDLKVVGNLSPINLKVSQTQCQFLLVLSKTVPAALIPDQELQQAEAAQSVPSSTLDMAQPTPPQGGSSPNPSHREPELVTQEESWVKLDFSFKVETVGLELILAEEGRPVGSVEAASLSKFFLSGTHVRLTMMDNGALESELLVQSFNVRDSRAKETNRFRKIMSLINTEVQQQFMASISMSAGEDRQAIAMLTIDSPRIIFALDYLFALQSFASQALRVQEEVTPDDASETSLEDSQTQLSSAMESPPEPTDEGVGDDRGGATPASATPMSIRVNVVDAQVILVANPTIPNTEAIVLGAKQMVYSQQNASTLQISKVGMFLCRMDKFESSRLRILDNFSLDFSMDNQTITQDCSMTRIDVHIEPLVLRLSLRDILLAIQIVNKASELRNPGGQPDTERDPKYSGSGKDSRPKSARRRSGIQQLPSNTPGAAPTSLVQQSAIIRKEKMLVEVDGLRVILLGDVHVLPLLDWRVNKFNVDVRDWSAEMSADTSIDTFINVYNFSKSAWEPLVEPYQIGFHMAKESSPEILTIEAFSHKNLELTVTSSTIVSASKSLQVLSTEEDVLAKPRGTESPYRVRNYTGFDLRVWADLEEGVEGPATTLRDGEEQQWSFEDPTTMRENLAPEGAAGTVGIMLEGSGFDSIGKIPIIREGEKLYNLRPKKDKVLHRLLVEVSLGPDYVKYITFRSPLVIENRTQIPIELGVYSPEEGHLLKIEKILPGDSRPAPVGAAFMHSLVVRPDQGFGYDWSTERLFWRDLIKRPTRSLKCNSERGSQSPPFYFQTHALYDKNDPILNVYPYMRIRISSPVEIQNLLPYDFKYRIYDRNTRKDWTNFLRKGGVSPVHLTFSCSALTSRTQSSANANSRSSMAMLRKTSREKTNSLYKMTRVWS